MSNKNIQGPVENEEDEAPTEDAEGDDDAEVLQDMDEDEEEGDEGSAEDEKGDDADEADEDGEKGSDDEESLGEILREGDSD